MSPAASSDLAIDLHRVTKIYRGRVHALRGVEMQVRKGEIFGLLGPNGAGKSTLVKIMMTVVRPTEANGTVLGQPIAHKPTLARVGYLPEHHRIPRYLTAAQALEFYGALALVDRETRRRRAAELLETVGMTDWASHRVATYSKGMLQRVGLAQALINDPDLVVLDEPTDGVDPAGRRDIRNVLTALRNRGKTVFVNSHLLSELEMICDRVAILNKGEVVKQGTIDELTITQAHYEIEVDGNGDMARAQRSIISAVPARWNESPADALETRGVLPGGRRVELLGATLHVATTQPGEVQPVIDQLRAAGLVIKSVRPMRPSLEDLFMEAVTDATGHAATPGAAIGGPR